MFKSIIFLAFATMSSAQKFHDPYGSPAWVSPTGSWQEAGYGASHPKGPLVGPGFVEPQAPFFGPGFAAPKGPHVEPNWARAPLPVEVAPLGGPVVTSAVAPEVINFPAPAVVPDAPLINLPKGAPEVVDVPHNNIVMPGDKLENKDLLLNLPSPLIEGPEPIIKPRDVVFRLPQEIFEIPKPSIQLKPIIHKVPYTLVTLTPQVRLREYLFKVPRKSGYVQPIPSVF